MKNRKDWLVFFETIFDENQERASDFLNTTLDARIRSYEEAIRRFCNIISIDKDTQDAEFAVKIMVSERLSSADWPKYPKLDSDEVGGNIEVYRSLVISYNKKEKMLNESSAFIDFSQWGNLVTIRNESNLSRNVLQSIIGEIRSRDFCYVPNEFTSEPSKLEGFSWHDCFWGYL